MTAPQQFGVGVWRMRDGSKAVVTRLSDDDYCFYPLHGHFDGMERCAQYWNRDGSWDLRGKVHEYDLVAPWEEPQPVPAPAAASDVKSLRDEFAIAALREIIANNLPFTPKPGQSAIEARLELAYLYADAGMKARKT